MADESSVQTLPATQSSLHQGKFLRRSLGGQRQVRHLFWKTFHLVRCIQLLVATSFVCPPLAALNPAHSPDSYSIQGWFTEQGLPSNKIRAVTQTSDGYLWVATSQGLARFDGNHFTAFTGASYPALRGGGFYALQETPDQTLWCAGDNGLFRWRNGAFERFTTEQGLADNHVRALTLTRNGTLVACTRAGYSFFRDGQITTPGGSWKQMTGSTRSYLERADGTIWLGTEDGLWRMTGDKLERLSGTEDFPGTAFNSLLETADGTLWIGSSFGVRALHPDGTRANYGTAQGMLNQRIATLRADRAGNLWIGTYAGLYRLSQGRLEAATYPGLISDSPVQQMHEDREGGWWAATAAGLFRLRDNVSKNIGPADGLDQTSVYSVLEGSDGNWWIGLWGGGVYRYDQKRATRLPVPTALGLDLVICLAESPAGTFWIGANSGLYRYSGDATVNLYKNESAAEWKNLHAAQPEALVPGIADRHVNALAPDPDGSLWVATDGALYHGHEGHFRAYTTADGLPGDMIKSVIRTRDGDIWITAPPFGVACLHQGRWTNYLCGKAISDIYPRAVFQDSTDDIWVTTEGGGLNRFKNGRWRIFTVRDGLADDFVGGIGEDAVGNLWIPGPRGIMRVARKQFDEVAEGKRAMLESRVFDRSDGLPPGELNQLGSPAVSCTHDGRMLFATSHGVAVIDPHQFKANDVIPPIRIERAVVDGVEANFSLPLVIPPGSHDVEIHYTALSFLAPEKVRFKIRLAPLDRDWVEAGSQREVRYAKLPAGEYTFQVMGSNNDGLWNPQISSIKFSVRPFFYQTPWFIGLVGCAVLGGIWLTYRLRLSQAEQRMKHLKTLVKERTRELQDAQIHLEKRVEERTAALQHAQEEASRDRARFKFIYEAVPVGISWSMPDEGITFLVNPAHERITGISAADSLTPGIFLRATHPEDRARQIALSEAFEHNEGSEYSVEKRYVHPDGRVLWAVLTERRFVDPASGKAQTVTTLADITELKRSQEDITRERTRFKFIFESVPVGISWMLNKEIATRIVNPAHARLTGVSIEQSHQLDIYIQRTHPHDRERQRELRDRLIAGEIDSYTIEKRYVHPDDSVRWVALTIRYFRDPAMEVAQELGVLVDITERKQAEAERESLHRQLLESSRLAGMAEVATGVLHNVGNVLNSVNIATSCVAESLRRFKSGNLSKVVALMREHEANLGEFITHDPKGKQLPLYLSQLADLLAKDQAGALKELGQLQKNVEHIKEIVTRQQSSVRSTAALETISPREIVEDALKMNAVTLGGHDIEVIRDFEDVPPFAVEKNKVLQILINLVRNSTQACEICAGALKKITVRIHSTGTSIRIAVADSGIGIAPENLPKIFSHGFTTKKDGHGFGLHSALLSAKELGGSLTVQSDGVGKGATFILELPLQPTAAAVSSGR